MPQLPLFVTSQNKLGATLGVGALTVFAYGLAGRLSLNLSPSLLPMTSWDLAIPLVPWTFWIYSSVYFIYLSSCYLQRDLKFFSKFLYGYLFAYGVSALFFLAYPTTFPRADFPLPAETQWLTRVSFEWFRSIDEPTNCLPSMHVGSCVMSTLPFYRRRPRVFIAFCAWTLAIALTTLTTKQHYITDVFAGAAFGVFTYWLISRVVSFRDTSLT